MYIFPFAQKITFSNFALRRAIVPWTTFTKGRHNLKQYAKFVDAHHPNMCQLSFFAASQDNIELFLMFVYDQLDEYDTYDFGWVANLRVDLPNLIANVSADNCSDLQFESIDIHDIVDMMDFYVQMESQKASDQHAYDRVHKNEPLRLLLRVTMKPKETAFIRKCMKAKYLDQSRNLLTINPLRVQIASWYNINYLIVPKMLCKRPCASGWDIRHESDDGIIANVTMGTKKFNIWQGLSLWSSFQVIVDDEYIRLSKRVRFQSMSVFPIEWSDAMTSNGIFKIKGARELNHPSAIVVSDEVEVKESENSQSQGVRRNFWSFPSPWGRP
eukprot:959126_1